MERGFVNRRQRVRFVTAGCYGLVAAVHAWIAYTHGLEAALRSAILLVAACCVLVAIMIWIERGK